MKKPIILIVAVLVITVCSLWSKCKSLSEDNERLTANNTALMDKATYFETEAAIRPPPFKGWSYPIPSWSATINTFAKRLMSWV